MKCLYNAACVTNVGKVRKNNEDNYFFGGIILPENHLSTDVLYGSQSIETNKCCSSGFAVGVFDGMGGEADGQVASYIAANDFKETIKQTYAYNTIESFLSSSTISMNAKVSEYATRRGIFCGTTSAIICFQDNKYNLCNVGDSKIFLHRQQKLIQISNDHNDAVLLKKLGANRKPRLLQYIGMNADGMTVEPYLYSDYVLDNDQFLLCSDGLTDMLQQDEIECIMNRELASKECVEVLLNEVLKRGAIDNTTIIIVRAQIVHDNHQL